MGRVHRQKAAAVADLHGRKGGVEGGPVRAGVFGFQEDPIEAGASVPNLTPGTAVKPVPSTPVR